ncbi:MULTISPECIES: hypothetical protein [unclassified Streptomyces]|uniref:hypothetical protein n=1 Tax=unclassified Streptomyces TaxID=2593676 RepID=UPI0035E01875
MSDPYYDPNETPAGSAGLPSPPGPAPNAPSAPPGPDGSPWPDPAPPHALPRTPEPATAFEYEPSRHSYPAMDGTRRPTRIPAPPGGAGPATNRVRIGLWGAPRSGKTTYLAALPIAAMQQQRYGRPNWVIGGMNPESNEFLSDGVTQLSIQRVFPDATVGLRSLSWSFQGEATSSGAFRRRVREVGFVLETQDVTGEAYRGDEENALRRRVLDQLADSQGLVYLFDPLLDAQRATESLNFLFSTLNELNSRVRDAGGLHRNRLPHHVSICVTKFDHPDVFRPAVEAGWVTQDSVGSQLPGVPTEQAARFFQWMCDDFRGSTARLVRDGLSNYFHPERISYYATSAIGFRLNPQHIFDYSNYLNVESVDGVPRICTSPVPINVLEPLTELENRIHDRKPKWRTR